MQTLALLSGGTDLVLLQLLSEKFKQHYDTEGYKKTVVYSGIQVLLKELKDADTALYIATNKRHLPTKQIMAYLNWESFFKGVFALDSFEPPITSKLLMLEKILANSKIDPANALYIGDRYEDGIAADKNHIAFAMVAWGYGDKSIAGAESHWMLCHKVSDLQHILIQ